jgi:hypothetical protein
VGRSSPHTTAFVPNTVAHRPIALILRHSPCHRRNAQNPKKSKKPTKKFNKVFLSQYLGHYIVVSVNILLQVEQVVRLGDIMLGGLAGLTNRSNNDWGERMLNTVASQSIRHLFSSSKLVDVEIQCNPSSKLLQGSIDSFKMKGQDLVIRREFQVEDMFFETDAVAIDPSALLSGKLQLKQPSQAIAKVTLSENAINQAFEAELVKKRLVNIESEALLNLSGGEPITFRSVKVDLLPQNQVKISAVTDLPNQSDVPIQMTATLAIEKRRRVLFDNPTFDADGIDPSKKGLSEVLTNAFAEILNEMVDLDRFDLDGVMMRLNRLETKGKQLIFSGYAQINHFPNKHKG